jgi:hypothetical protein
MSDSHVLKEQRGKKGRGTAIIPPGPEWEAFVRYAKDTDQPLTYEVYVAWKRIVPERKD